MEELLLKKIEQIESKNTMLDKGIDSLEETIKLLESNCNFEQWQHNQTIRSEQILYAERFRFLAVRIKIIERELYKRKKNLDV